MTTDQQDHANVMVLPPLLYLFSFGLGIALEFIWPIDFWVWSYNGPIGWVLIGLSAIVLLLAMRHFRQTGQDPNPKTSTPILYTGGIYRLSRNPIYLSFTGISFGLALLLNSMWIVLMLIPTTLIMHYAVIRPEERYLTRKFGDQYTAYQAKVRRWL